MMDSFLSYLDDVGFVYHEGRRLCGLLRYYSSRSIHVEYDHGLVAVWDGQHLLKVTDNKSVAITFLEELRNEGFF